MRLSHLLNDHARERPAAPCVVQQKKDPRAADILTYGAAHIALQNHRRWLRNNASISTITHSLTDGGETPSSYVDTWHPTRLISFSRSWLALTSTTTTTKQHQYYRMCFQHSSIRDGLFQRLSQFWNPTTARWVAGQYSCTGLVLPRRLKKTQVTTTASAWVLPTFAERAFVCACIFFPSAQHLPRRDGCKDGFSCDRIKGTRGRRIGLYVGHHEWFQGRSFESRRRSHSSLGQAATPVPLFCYNSHASFNRPVLSRGRTE
jgi:hypothetical protein